MDNLWLSRTCWPQNREIIATACWPHHHSSEDRGEPQALIKANFMLFMAVNLSTATNSKFTQLEHIDLHFYNLSNSAPKDPT